METSLCHSSFSPLPHPCPKNSCPNILPLSSSPKKRATRVFALQGGSPGRDFDAGGNLVDENMIVLRMRIQELEAMEKGNHEVPSHWMEWEKRYHGKYYHSDIFEGVGVLQRMLMSSRPCLGLGMIVLVASSLPASMAMLLFHLLTR